MGSPKALLCDGCGQPASPEHLAARLKRLEWATRFRPVHISVLFLGAASPADENDFLYAGAGEETPARPAGAVRGEARQILYAAGLISLLEGGSGGRAEALAAFQHRGYFLTHVLECPLSLSPTQGSTVEQAQLPRVLVRIRRSLRPKRIALVAQSLDVLIPRLAGSDLGPNLLLNKGKAFALDAAEPAAEVERLRQALLATTG